MNNRRIALGAFIVILLAIVITVFLVKKPTQTRQNASGSDNINNSSDIAKTNNPNGTMGPDSPSKNYSTTIPSSDLGSLTVLAMDQGSKVPADYKEPSKGVQKVRSLILRINKMEVHLDRVGNGFGAKNVNKWETLYMQNPVSFDLVQLVNGTTVNLSLSKLSMGNYKELRLYVERATAVLTDGKLVFLQMPDKLWTIRVVRDFSIDKNKNTNLLIKFDSQKSVDSDGKNYFLKSFVSDLTINK